MSKADKYPHLYEVAKVAHAKLSGGELSAEAFAAGLRGFSVAELEHGEERLRSLSRFSVAHHVKGALAEVQAQRARR